LRVAALIAEPQYDETTSSGYDTEEVVDPFLEPGEYRLVVYDFEPQADDHVELKCGDKVIVEETEGEVICCVVFSTLLGEKKKM
jgi:hypothetical protein